MMIYELLIIALGATLGAWLRYGLGLLMNPVIVGFPLGTLTVNLIGGFGIGIVLSISMMKGADWPAIYRLFLATGFLGGFTTFSAFSAEVIAAWIDERWALGLGISASHLIGSLLMTALGWWIAQSLQQ